MTLETLLMPFKWTDEALHRRYARIAIEQEKKGKDKYDLATEKNKRSSYQLLLAASTANTTAVIIADLTFSFLQRRLQTKENERLRDYEIAEMNSKTKKTEAEMIRKWHKNSRLFYFGCGIYLLADGVSNVFDAVRESNPYHGIRAVHLFSAGLGFINSAKASYVLDSDPKVLDKQSSFSQAKDRLVNAIKSYLPIPQPIPQPARALTS